MGPGHPDQITVQAVQALNRVDVFFRIDKGDAKSGLNAARDEILHRHVTRPGYRVVEIPSRRGTGRCPLLAPITRARSATGTRPALGSSKRR